jgi:hypothetical protein
MKWHKVTKDVERLIDKHNWTRSFLYQEADTYWAFVNGLHEISGKNKKKLKAQVTDYVKSLGYE